MTTTRSLSIAGMVAAALVLCIATSMAATRVELNGNPVSFDVAPFQVAGRTMVPMRAIFEALGAEVEWNASSQTVTATRGATNVRLTIGRTTARVNGRNVSLDVPAMVRRGSTMVPLRFVSEALGANVEWIESSQTVYLSTDGSSYTGGTASMETVVVPLGTVIPVSLDTGLSSSSSKLGDGFSVTVRSSQEGDAEFPRGTRFVGNVVGIDRATRDKPGMLDLSFREAWMPDGSKVNIAGSLISLDDKSVTRNADGRLVATVKGTGNDRLKMIGIGAGAGLLIGKLLDRNMIVGGLLGAAAGYLYNEYTTDEVDPTDVVVQPGTVFGVRMDRDVAYSAPSSFVAARNDAHRN